MSRTLADVISEHVGAVFLNTDHFAVDITYTRGASSVELKALVEPSIFDNLTDDGGATKTERRGYLIEASKLILSGVVTLPQIGDLITEGSYVYVIPKRTEGVRYEYADENRLLLRVNTTLKSGT